MKLAWCQGAPVLLLGLWYTPFNITALHICQWEPGRRAVNCYFKLSAWIDHVGCVFVTESKCKYIENLHMTKERQRGLNYYGCVCLKPSLELISVFAKVRS